MSTAGEAKKRQVANGGDKKSGSPKLGEPITNTGAAAKIAAKTVGASHGYVSDAKRLAEKAPDVAEAARRGALNMPEAKVAAGSSGKRIFISEAKSLNDILSAGLMDRLQRDPRPSPFSRIGITGEGVDAFAIALVEVLNRLEIDHDPSFQAAVLTFLKCFLAHPFSAQKVRKNRFKSTLRT